MSEQQQTITEEQVQTILMQNKQLLEEVKHLRENRDTDQKVMRDQDLRINIMQEMLHENLSTHIDSIANIASLRADFKSLGLEKDTQIEAFEEKLNGATQHVEAYTSAFRMIGELLGLQTEAVKFGITDISSSILVATQELANAISGDDVDRARKALIASNALIARSKVMISNAAEVKEKTKEEAKTEPAPAPAAEGAKAATGLRQTIDLSRDDVYQEDETEEVVEETEEVVEETEEVVEETEEVESTSGDSQEPVAEKSAQ